MLPKNCYIYCNEDISLIENYNKALNDKNQTWEVHHRIEIDLNLSYKELMKRKLYFNRPASELILLTKREHRQLHCLNGVCNCKGKHNTETHNKNISKAKKELYSDPVERKKQSERLKGKSKNKCWMSNGINQVFIKKEDIEYYTNRGYHFGRK